MSFLGRNSAIALVDPELEQLDRDLGRAGKPAVTQPLLPARIP